MIWLFVCPSVTHSISILLPSLSDWSPSSGLTSGPADPFDEIRFSIYLIIECTTVQFGFLGDAFA